MIANFQVSRYQNAVQLTSAAYAKGQLVFLSMLLGVLSVFASFIPVLSLTFVEQSHNNKTKVVVTSLVDVNL